MPPVMFLKMLLFLTLCFSSVTKADDLLDSLVSNIIHHISPNSCDLIFLTSHNQTMKISKMLSTKFPSDPKLYLDTNTVMPRLKTSCYQIVFEAHNMDEIFDMEMYPNHAKSPNHLLLILQQEVPQETTFPKYPFDTTIMTMKNDTAVNLVTYSAINDPKWKNLKVAYMQWYPELFHREDGSLTGTAHDIWSILQSKLQFKFDSLTNVKTVPNSVGLFQNGSIDLVIPHDVYSTSMLEVADMTPFVFQDTFLFYNAKPGPVTSLLTLVYPFEKEVWILSILSFAFVFMASILIKTRLWVSVFRIIQIILSPLLSDSSAVKRQKTNVHSNWYGYTVLFIWFMCGLLLSQSYTSNLLASLTIVKTEGTDNTFEDLVRNKRTLGVPKGTAFVGWLKNSPRDIVRKAEKECVEERGGYYDVRLFKGVPPQLMDKLEDGEASSIIVESLFPKLAHKYRLGTDVLKRTFNTYYIRRNYPLKPKIDHYLNLLTDSGITLQIRQRYIWGTAKASREFQRSGKNDQERNIKITIKHLYPLWLVCGIGLFLGKVAVLFEFLNIPVIIC